MKSWLMLMANTIPTPAPTSRIDRGRSCQNTAPMAMATSTAEYVCRPVEVSEKPCSARPESRVDTTEPPTAQAPIRQEPMNSAAMMTVPVITPSASTISEKLLSMPKPKPAVPSAELSGAGSMRCPRVPNIRLDTAQNGAVDTGRAKRLSGGRSLTCCSAMCTMMQASDPTTVNATEVGVNPT